MTEYGDVEAFYLYRVESYLVHKYAPDLVDTFKLSFAKARLEKVSMLKRDDNVFHSVQDLIEQIQRDISMAPVRRKSENHHRVTERPHIGEDYQDRFNEL